MNVMGTVLKSMTNRHLLFFIVVIRWINEIECFQFRNHLHSTRETESNRALNTCVYRNGRVQSCFLLLNNHVEQWSYASYVAC